MMGELVSTQDHDLIIQLHTKMDGLVSDMAVIKDLEYRTRQLEEKGSRHSEKISAINVATATDHAELVKRVDKLEAKSNIWDILNSFGIFVSAAIGYYLHK